MELRWRNGFQRRKPSGDWDETIGETLIKISDHAPIVRASIQCKIIGVVKGG